MNHRIYIRLVDEEQTNLFCAAADLSIEQMLIVVF